MYCGETAGQNVLPLGREDIDSIYAVIRCLNLTGYSRGCCVCMLYVRRYIRRPESHRQAHMSVTSQGDRDDDVDHQSADDGIYAHLYTVLWFPLTWTIGESRESGNSPEIDC